MKKIRSIFAMLIVLTMSIATINVQANTSSIDKNNLNNGIIGISYEAPKDVKTKIMIQKDDVKYTYTLQGNNKFPLQLGNGDYSVKILEQVQGTSYKQVEEQIVSLNIENNNAVYLQSNQIINWTKDMNAIKKAKKLTMGAKTDREKVNAIYQYVIKNIDYDSIKIKSIQGTSYAPSIEDTYKTSQGICYDYSALMAAMLRSVGVPTKLVMGYNDDMDVYHAWNQVYLEDINAWVTVDSTYDAAARDAKISYKMIKNETEYSVEKVY